MIKEQKNAALIVKKSSESIEYAINSMYEHLISNKQGRLIYVGAGTSGRIGVQDGVELFPTFHWPKDRLDFIIAGGKRALLEAVEDAEDSIINAKRATEKLLVNSNDVVIGLAASGNTPFTCTVMEEATKKNALTIAISNNPKGIILKNSKIKIANLIISMMIVKT